MSGFPFAELLWWVFASLAISGALGMVFSRNPMGSLLFLVLSFFSLAADMLCVATLDGRLKRTNPAFGRVLGWSEADLSGRALIDLVHADDAEATRAALTQLQRDEEIVDFENRCRCRRIAMQQFGA